MRGESLIRDSIADLTIYLAEDIIFMLQGRVINHHNLSWVLKRRTIADICSVTANPCDGLFFMFVRMDHGLRCRMAEN